MVKHLPLFFLFFITSASSAKILIATVAQVKSHVITSREVVIHSQVDDVLGKRFQEYDKNNPMEEVIREWLLYLEASGFYNTPIPRQQVDKMLATAQQRLAKAKGWSKLDVSSAELRDKIVRRLESERIYQFKKKASVLPVSLSEIETEYSQNRIRYGNESFEAVKEKIRQQKVEENLILRMQQWFSVLEKKYKVQRFSNLSETQ